MDLLAAAVAMGATPVTKTVTELTFPGGRKLLLETLLEMDVRDALQHLISFAVPPPSQVFRQTTVTR